MIRVFRRHLSDYSEQVQRYGYIGVLTASVGLFTFWTMQYLLQMNANAANAVSVVLAVTFGYITNKLIVFRSQTQSIRSFLLEMIRFILSRAVTILLEVICFAALLGIIGGHQLLIRGVVSFIVFVSNYLFSHYFVFDKAEPEER